MPDQPSSLVTRHGVCTAEGFLPANSPSWPRWSTFVSGDAVRCTSVTARRGSQSHLWNGQPRQSTQLPATASIIGCAHNIAPALDHAHLETIGGVFRDYRVTIWEDGSRDNTAAKLQSWAARNPRVRILLGDTPAFFGIPSILHRVYPISFCRSVLLAEVMREHHGMRNHNQSEHEISAPVRGQHGHGHGHGRWSSLAQVLVSIDLDCPPVLTPSAVGRAVHTLLGLGSWSQGGVRRAGSGGGEGGGAAATEATKGWDALFGNSLPRYYDVWALRSTALGIDYDCLHNKTEARKRGVCFDYDLRLDPAAPVLEVDSAFNGVGIYRVASLHRARDAAGALCRYGGTKLHSGCEHVGFHMCLRGAGLRLGIAPDLVTGCGAEHARDEYMHEQRVTLRANGDIVQTKVLYDPTIVTLKRLRRAARP